MRRSPSLLALSAALTLFLSSAALGGENPFVPSVPVMGVEKLSPGQEGLAYTVVSGSSVVSFPVTILSVIPQSGRPANLIAVRASGPVIDETGGIAAGMSGSPVYVDGKLIGAIGYGWNFSDHKLGLVTPIADMIETFEWKDQVPSFMGAAAQTRCAVRTLDSNGFAGFKNVLSLSGIAGRSKERLSQALGSKTVLSGGCGARTAVETGASLVPGDAVGALLVWGDVTLGAVGTLSAMGKDGRFLAFGHPFIRGGSVAYPLAKAYIHQIVPSLESPFKIGSFGHIVGTVTQDRPQAIGGRMGYFAPSVDMSFRLYDRDDSSRHIKRFRVVPDPVFLSKIAPPVFLGLMDSAWGRSGMGTAKLTVTFEGGGLPKGWNYTDFLFSPTDLAGSLADRVSGLVSAIVLNPHKELAPLGVHFAVDVESAPRILYVDKVTLDKTSYEPGDQVSVSVDLRPYRGRSEIKNFSLTIPEKASGVCQVVVRGGGLGEPDGGQGEMNRSIPSLDDLLRELSDRERANEVVIELAYPAPVSDDMELETLPPLGEYPGEVRRRKLKEGSMKVYRSDYYVEGSLEKSLLVIPKN